MLKNNQQNYDDFIKNLQISDGFKLPKKTYRSKEIIITITRINIFDKTVQYRTSTKTDTMKIVDLMLLTKLSN